LNLNRKAVYFDESQTGNEHFKWLWNSTK